VYFSPGGQSTEAIVWELDHAKQSIDLQAYNFTSAPIAKALVDAHNRGIKVRAMLDKSNKTAQYSSSTFLFNAGVPTFIDAKHAIPHNKVILIDGKTIITGLMNFTKAGEKENAENLLIIEQRYKLAAVYARNFAEHLEHAEKYEGLPAKEN
jgi:phosphatidylserine/phosphatidylglycerophosphate/cardiolipin synthase-like enzyme